jgi:serine/threonine protein kinase
MEKTKILEEYPLTKRIIENVYISTQGCKKYVVKYVENDNHEFVKEIELIKLLNQIPGPDIAFNALNETQIRKFDSQYVYKYVTTIEKENIRYLVTEYSGNDMCELIIHNTKSFTEKRMRQIFYDLVCGVKELHSMGIAHGDISPENICMQEQVSKNGSTIKIIDMAFSLIHPKSPYNDIYKIFKECERVKIYDTKNVKELPTKVRRELFKTKTKGSFLGKIYYMSPERYMAQTTDTVYCAFKDDIYALGVILYLLNFGTIPYTEPWAENNKFKNIINGSWKRKLRIDNYLEKYKNHTKHSNHGMAIDLIDKILKNETERLTINEILSHPWLEKHND